MSDGNRLCGKGPSDCFIHWLFGVNLNSNNAFSRTRIVFGRKYPKQKFQNDFHLVSLFLHNPGSREPVYIPVQVLFRLDCHQPVSGPCFSENSQRQNRTLYPTHKHHVMVKASSKPVESPQTCKNCNVGVSHAEFLPLRLFK